MNSRHARVNTMLFILQNVLSHSAHLGRTLADSEVIVFLLAATVLGRPSREQLYGP